MVRAPEYSLSDVPVAVSLLAGGVGGDGDVDAVEDCGLVAPGLECAPARHSGQLSSEVLTS